jgi:hypothetical protein
MAEGAAPAPTAGGAAGPRELCWADGCGNPYKQRCSRCFMAGYCCATCQKAHWRVHKHDSLCVNANDMTRAMFKESIVLPPSSGVGFAHNSGAAHVLHLKKIKGIKVIQVVFPIEEYIAIGDIVLGCKRVKWGIPKSDAIADLVSRSEAMQEELYNGMVEFHMEYGHVDFAHTVVSVPNAVLERILDLHKRASDLERDVKDAGGTPGDTSDVPQIHE